jgi:pyruvate kinase
MTTTSTSLNNNQAYKTKTRIITTIGPTSDTPEILAFFKEHKVEIARLNFSHGTNEKQIESGINARKAGLKLLMDLQGPKIRVGVLPNPIHLAPKQDLILELEKTDKVYPYYDNGVMILPSQVDLAKSLVMGNRVLIDDGKVELQVSKVENGQVFCQVRFEGLVKSHKGINLPDSALDISFLTEVDKEKLEAILPVLKPEIVAASFVRTAKDMQDIKTIISRVLDVNSITDYFPQVCAKIEQPEAVQDQNLKEIVQISDLIMIARGDLALETNPLHLAVPFLQDKIVKECKKQNKPFVIATQILESMIETSVPTRAEVSDLYRAVILQDADYIMLSGESASGKFPTKCVELMSKMIEEKEKMMSLDFGKEAKIEQEIY